MLQSIRRALIQACAAPLRAAILRFGRLRQPARRAPPPPAEDAQAVDPGPEDKQSPPEPVAAAQDEAGRARIDQAWSLFRSGQLHEARKIFIAVADKAPEEAESWRGLGAISRQSGDRAGALRNFQIAAKLAPDDLYIKIDLAWEQHALGQIDEALARFTEVTEKAPGESQGWRGLGVAARQKGDRALALAAFKALAALNPQHIQTIVDLAWEQHALGELDNALARFREVTELAPGEIEGWRGLGVVARQKGDRTLALTAFKAAAKLNPQHIQTVVDLAWEHHALGQLDDALARFQDVAEKTPGEIQGWRGLGVIARQKGNRALALTAFKAAAKLNPQHIQTVVDLAWEHHALSQLNDALACFQTVTEKAPGEIQGWRGLGVIARQKGDRALALTAFKAAAELDPQHLQTLVDLAWEQHALGQIDDALARFQTVTEKAPGEIQGWRGLGVIARQKGDRALALAAFKSAAKLHPDHVQTVVDLGWEHHALGQFDDAFACFRQATENLPTEAQGWRGLAMIARQKGDRVEALRLFRRAVALEPGGARSAPDVALELLALERPQEAEDFLRPLIERGLPSGALMIAWAKTIRRHAPAQDMIDILERAVAAEPNDPAARIALADEYMRNWRLDRAEQHFDAALGLQTENGWACMGKGRIARARGLRPQALHWFERAQNVPINREAATIEVSRERFELGDYDEARRILLDASPARPASSGAYLQSGFFARAHGDHANAYADFTRASELSGGQGAAFVELAREEFYRGRQSLAISMLKDAAGKPDSRVKALEALASIAEVLDETGRAVEFREAAIARNCPDVWIHLRLARGLLRAGRLEKALDVLARCETAFGMGPEIWLTRIEIWLELGDRQAANRAIAEASSRFPNFFDIWRHKVKALIHAGEFEDARRTCDDSPAQTPADHAATEALRGEIRAAQWDLEGACAHVVAALALDSSNPHYSEQAARLALLRLDADEAWRRLRDFTRNNLMHTARNLGAAKPSQTLLGQIVDDFRIDANHLAKLRDSAAAPDPLAAIGNLVRKHPDSTAASVALLIALRQRKRFRPATLPGASEIPARIAQYWDGDIPDDVAKLCDRWRDLNPDFSYRRFDKAQARRFIGEHGPDGALAAFDRSIEAAKKADIFRLVFLRHAGGFYVDADDRCLAPLASLGLGACDLALYQEEFGTVGNNFIGVRPDHPAIVHALTAAIEAVNRGDSDSLWLSTGPALLSRSVAFHLAGDMEARLARTVVLERHELGRVAAIHTLTSHKHNKKHWNRATVARSGRSAALFFELAAQERVS